MANGNYTVKGFYDSPLQKPQLMGGREENILWTKDCKKKKFILLLFFIFFDFYFF